jgi:hypothetical protein
MQLKKRMTKKRDIEFNIVQIKKKVYNIRIILLFLFVIIYSLGMFFLSDEPTKSERIIRTIFIISLFVFIAWYRFLKKPYKEIGILKFYNDAIVFWETQILIDEIERIEIQYEGYRGDFPSAGFFGIGAFDMTDGCNNNIRILKKDGNVIDLYFLSKEKFDYGILKKLKQIYENKNVPTQVSKKNRILKKQNKLFMKSNKQ